MEYDLENPKLAHRIPKCEDILRNVIPLHTERVNGETVFAFYTNLFENAKGIIYPNDDVLFLNRSYDVILNNVLAKGGSSFLISSEIYHEFSVKDTFPVRISRISRRDQPMFKLFGFIGFVCDGTLEIGQKVNVQIERMKEGRDGGLNILETRLCSLIEN